jgi:hypothetical protein
MAMKWKGAVMVVDRAWVVEVARAGDVSHVVLRMNIPHHRRPGVLDISRRTCSVTSLSRSGSFNNSQLYCKCHSCQNIAESRLQGGYQLPFDVCLGEAERRLGPSVSVPRHTPPCKIHHTFTVYILAGRGACVGTLARSPLLELVLPEDHRQRGRQERSGIQARAVNPVRFVRALQDESEGRSGLADHGLEDRGAMNIEDEEGPRHAHADGVDVCSGAVAAEHLVGLEAGDHVRDDPSVHHAPNHVHAARLRRLHHFLDPRPDRTEPMATGSSPRRLR